MDSNTAEAFILFVFFSCPLLIMLTLFIPNVKYREIDVLRNIKLFLCSTYWLKAVTLLRRFDD